jgi:hypothetical protein
MEQASLPVLGLRPWESSVCTAASGLWLLAAIGRMLAVIGWLTHNPVVAYRPKTQIDHLASLGAERPVTIRRTVIGDLLANGTDHCSMTRDKVSDGGGLGNRTHGTPNHRTASGGKVNDTE